MKHTEDFDTYYRSIWKERWDALKASFAGENDYCTLSEGLLKPYFLDRASVYPAQALDVQPGDCVLDLCAAPGGKTLILALAKGEAGTMVANDKSADRRARLKAVVTEHLPAAIASTVRITGYDAATWGLYQQAMYDRVLLDAPCSSERHVRSSPYYLAQWTPARTKQLAIRQFAMLAAALDAAKAGGRVVYSTCSISPLENDGVIEKLFKKRKDMFDILQVEPQIGEKTKYGIQILPDTTGAGPIYYCTLEKRHG